MSKSSWYGYLFCLVIIIAPLGCADLFAKHIKNPLCTRLCLVLNHIGSINKKRIIQDTYFTYDTNGNILVEVVNGKKTTYGYNAINQLITINKPNGSALSLAGSYDRLGNLKSDEMGSQCTYNLLGQLTGLKDKQTGIETSYRYYVNGLRSEKYFVSSSFGIEPIRYYYDGDRYANIVNEKQGKLATGYLLQRRHMLRYIYSDQGGTQKQIAVYGSKDVEAVLNSNGRIQKAYHYSPDGLITLFFDQPRCVSFKPKYFKIVDNPFLYSGEYRDLESGLIYLRSRYYNPSIHRFMQRDSYQLSNRYNYAQDNPIMSVDPSGHSAIAMAMHLTLGAFEIFSGAILAHKTGNYFWSNGLLIAGGIDFFSGLANAAFGKDQNAKWRNVLGQSAANLVSSYSGLFTEIFGKGVLQKFLGTSTLSKAFSFVGAEYLAGAFYDSRYLRDISHWSQDFAFNSNETNYFFTAGPIESFLKPLTFKIAKRFNPEDMEVAEKYVREQSLSQRFRSELFGEHSFNRPSGFSKEAAVDGNAMQKSLRNYNCARLINSRIWYSIRSMYRTFGNQGAPVNEGHNQAFDLISAIFIAHGLNAFR